MKQRITVSEKHIQNGFQSSIGRCPVALAFRDSSFQPEIVYVISQLATLYKEGSCESYQAELPAEVTERIVRYDEGGGMEPFEFEIEILQKYLPSEPQEEEEEDSPQREEAVCQS